MPAARKNSTAAIVIAGPAWLAAAVPVSTKIPVPMMAPIPSRVRSHAERLRRRALPPCSTSPTSCSIDFVLNRFESIPPPNEWSDRLSPIRECRGWQTPAIIVGRQAECADFGGFLLFAGLLVAERVVMLAHALGLFGREVVHADVVDVVHEVGDRIVAREGRAN